ncbi:MAG: L-threonylcarbamoyladenylate synthase [Chlamydiota bacterium]
METDILKGLDLRKAVDFLKKGEPIVFPTETVYGLGAEVFNEAGIRRIFAIKGRPLDNPLIAHIATLEMAAVLSDALSPIFYHLAKQFWPGPLTLVVKRRPEVPALVSAGLPTIAIRMPSHPIARKLIEAVGSPLVAPSANLSGRPSPTCLRDVLEDLQGKVALVIDGGECEVGIESTVLSLVHPVPTLLRPGKITKAMLQEVLGCAVDLPSGEGPILSPGMKYRHYAPKAQIRLVYKVEDLKEGFILAPSPIPGKKVRFLSAKTLFAALREADRLRASEIEVYCDPTVLADEGLMNRLLCASGIK